MSDGDDEPAEDPPADAADDETEGAEEGAGPEETESVEEAEAEAAEATEEAEAAQTTDEQAATDEEAEAEADGEAADTGAEEEADAEGEEPDAEEESDAEGEEPDAEEEADAEGDDEPAADEQADASADEETDGEVPDVEVTVDSLDERLDAAEADVEAAETEADLDAVESDLDAIEADLEAADLPEPEDEDEEDPAERLAGRVEDVREALAEQRGPYAEDVVEAVEAQRERLVDTRWTETGEAEAKAAVVDFLDDAGEALGESFAVDGDSLEAHGDALDDVAAAVEGADLDPDADAEVVESLVAATEALETALDEAEEWSDLTVVQQLTARGFYDRLTSENRKDFPPELGVVRIAEQENDPERILMALEKLESDFMEENCIDALRRLGAPEALDAMLERAQKRDIPSIEVLGKIGDDEACDTLHGFIQDESNPPLQKATLRALGEIGSEESTQAVANRLVAEDAAVRSEAARALGRIGDARAVDPLADVLSDDDDDAVRASAAWALVQVGIETALEAAREHDDDRSYLVQSEAEKAAAALDDAEAPTA